jgi:hypothetical protein
MTATDQIRNGLIEKIMTINNKDFLSALFQIINNSSTENKTVKLSEEQIVMLNLSENDIKNGNLITHTKLDHTDLKWLKEL